MEHSQRYVLANNRKIVERGGVLCYSGGVVGLLSRVTFISHQTEPRNEVPTSQESGSGLWMRRAQRNTSSRGRRFIRTEFPHQPSPHTTAPARASRIKWFAVAMMARSMSIGYASPIVRQRRRVGEGISNLTEGLERRLTQRGRVAELLREDAGAGKGMVIIVRPIISE